MVPIKSQLHILAAATLGRSHRAGITRGYLPQEASTRPEWGNHSKRSRSLYSEAGSILSTLHALTHLISATHPTGRHYYYPHFTDEVQGQETVCTRSQSRWWQSLDMNPGRVSESMLSTPAVQPYRLLTLSEKIHPILLPHHRGAETSPPWEASSRGSCL